MTTQEEKGVSLRDYFDAKLKSVKQAVRVAKTENDRRLEELNNLRKEYSEDRGKYVLLEIFNSQSNQFSKDFQIVTNRLTAIETRIITWTAALGFFFTLLQIGLAFCYYFLIHKS